MKHTHVHNLLTIDRRRRTPGRPLKSLVGRHSVKAEDGLILAQFLGLKKINKELFQDDTRMRLPIPASARSKARVRIPPGLWISVCCQVKVSAICRSLVQGSLTECVCVCVCVIE